MKTARLVVGLALGSLFLSGFGVVAQPKAPEKLADTASTLTVANKRYDAAKELARLSKRYGLSDEQRAKIEPLLLDQQKQVHALGEDESLSDAAWATGVRKIHTETVAQVKRLLTDAQAAKYAKDEAKSLKATSSGDDDDFGPPDGPPPDGGPGGPGGGGPPPGE